MGEISKKKPKYFTPIIPSVLYTSSIFLIRFRDVKLIILGIDSAFCFFTSLKMPSLCIPIGFNIQYTTCISLQQIKVEKSDF